MIPGIVASQVIGALDAGGGASDAVLEYLGAHYDATNQTTYTFAGIDFGVAAADRVIIVAFKLGSDGGGNLTNSVTIGGVTATEVTSAAFADIVPIGLFYAEVPTGTSGDVVITGANSPQNCALQVWAAYDVDPEPHAFFSAASNGSGTSIGSVVDVPDGGFLVAAWGANHADLNASWTGAVEEAERVTGEQTFEAASDQQMAEETERSVSVSHAAATHRRMVCGTWAPGEGGGGDTTPPTITSSNTGSVAENIVLAHSLTANEAVTWSLVGGADQARYELSGSTLRWLSNGTKNFEAPDDADTNNTYVVTVRATDTALNTTDQTITYTVTDVDEVAPTLSSATGTATSDTEADLSVSTDEGNGTLYWVVTQSATDPTEAQVKLGQDHLGAAADDAGSQAVSGTGVQNITGGATGLTAETEYWAHFMHEDTATNQSDVATSASFETDAAGGTWQDTFTGSPSSDSGSWNNFTLRQRLPASALSVSGTETRLTLHAGAGENLTVTKMFIGHAAAAGDAYDFETTPVQVQVGASNSWTITAGNSVVTDAAVFALDETKPLIVSFYFGTTADTIRHNTSAGVGVDYYFKAGDDAATVNATGYTGNSGRLACISKIEVLT